MENVNYCKQLIDLGEEHKVLFLQLLVWSEFFKIKKKWQRNDKREKENGKREIGNHRVLEVFL